MAQSHSPEPDTAPGPDARLSRPEARVATPTEAVRALAQGLESIPSKDTPPAEAARGARLAHELLLSGGP